MEKINYNNAMSEIHPGHMRDQCRQAGCAVTVFSGFFSIVWRRRFP
jgi:hypothetical protein